MFNQFNDINKNLEILAEECAEVIQIKSKIIRFGMDDVHPNRGKSNREALEQELGDVLSMIDILIDNGVLDKENIRKAKHRKTEKLKEWYTQINPDTYVCKCHVNHEWKHK